MDMDFDLELEMKIFRRELRVLFLHEFRWGRKTTEATYAARWGRMYSPYVQRNIGSIGPGTATSNSTIYLTPEDRYRWIRMS
jgi:hypothetical protein